MPRKNSLILEPTVKMANFKLFALFVLTLVAVANAGPSKGDFKQVLFYLY